MLVAALGVFANDDWSAKQKYETALALINSIDGVGQKIASMFLKFLIYFSKNFEGKTELEKELFIPLDAHVLRLLFVKLNGENPDRLNLYDEPISQASLTYNYQKDPIRIIENKTVRLQKKIREDFEELGIDEAPVILDYLWYVGTMYCRNKFGDIGCKICFLRDECETGQL